MKPKTTLKEVIKFPFKHDDCAVGDVLCSFRTAGGGIEQRRVMQIRGWGSFQYYENGEELQDEFKDWVVQALNEKLERDFGEPLRWEYDEFDVNDFTVGCFIECPECKAGYEYDHNYENFFQMHHYCPSCGVRLLPPKEVE